ncbi:MAG: hypothetical protein ACR2KI_07645 [Candidatus Limnocylindria bacterium]
MKRARTLPAAAALALLCLGTLVPTAAAGDFRTGSDVVVAADQTVQGDLYAAGGTVTIDGTVTGDLSATGGTIIVRGKVGGSVNAAGGTIEITGPVGGAVRTAGGTTRIASSVGRDVVVVGGTLALEASATVSGDVAGGAGTLLLAGTVNGNLLTGSGAVDLTGNVKGNVQATSDRVTIGPHASIGGNLDYTAQNPASIDPGARIGGTVSHRRPTNQRSPALVENPVFSLLGGFLMLLLLGWGLLALRPRTVTGPGAELRTRPLLALGAGLGTWIGQFLVVIALFIIGAVVAALAGPIGGAFFVPAMLVLLLIAVLTIVSQVPVAMAIGSFAWRRRDPSPYLAYAAGAAIWAAILFVTGLINGGLGFLAYLAGWIMALGAITLYALRTRSDPVVVTRAERVVAVAPPPEQPPAPQPPAP